MGTIATSLLEGSGWCIDADVDTVLLRRGRSHLDGLKNKTWHCWSSCQQAGKILKTIIQNFKMSGWEQWSNKSTSQPGCGVLSPETQQVRTGRCWPGPACQCSKGGLCSCNQAAARDWGRAAACCDASGSVGSELMWWQETGMMSHLDQTLISHLRICRTRDKVGR